MPDVVEIEIVAAADDIDVVMLKVSVLAVPLSDVR